MSAEIEKALNLIRPGLQADGGNVELVEVTDDGVVKVKLTGACGCCPMSAQTLKFSGENAQGKGSRRYRGCCCVAGNQQS